MKLFLGSLFLLFICRLICSCEEDYTLLKKYQGFRNESYFRNDSLIKFDSIEKKYFVEQSIPETMGIMANYQVPIEYGKKRFKIVVQGKFKTNNPTSNAEIVLSTENIKNMSLTFTGKKLRYYTLDVNKLCEYKDSFYLKYDNWETLKNISIRSYLFTNKKETIKFDTINVSVYYLD